jgi:putative hydrolase of the HAD superfamily
VNAQPLAVSFDAGGTLLEPWPSVGHAYAAVARRWCGVAPDVAAINRRFQAAWAARGAAFDYSRAAWAGLVATVMRGLSPCAEGPGFFAALYDHFAGPEPWRVFPDVVPTLTALRRRGLRLAVVSNWDARLRPLLAALGLAEFFEVIVVSGEVGWHKPDPRLFDHAAGQLGLPPDRISTRGRQPRRRRARRRAGRLAGGVAGSKRTFHRGGRRAGDSLPGRAGGVERG